MSKSVIKRTRIKSHRWNSGAMYRQIISEEMNSLKQSPDVIRRSVRSMETRCRRCIERDVEN